MSFVTFLTINQTHHNSGGIPHISLEKFIQRKALTLLPLLLASATENITQLTVQFQSPFVVVNVMSYVPQLQITEADGPQMLSYDPTCSM